MDKTAAILGLITIILLVWLLLVYRSRRRMEKALGRRDERAGQTGGGGDGDKSSQARTNFQQELKLQRALAPDVIATAMLDLTERQIIDVQTHAEQSGIDPVALTFGSFLQSAMPKIVDDERVRGIFASLTSADLLEMYATGKTNLSVEYLRRLPAGDRWVREELHMLPDPESDDLMLFVSLRDIDRDKRREASLTQAAETDSMTGLTNHDATMRHIAEFLGDKGKNGVHALFMIDIDNFKSVNDNHGHQWGDKAIVAVAASVRKLFRAEDIVGRMGGDEFLAFMKNVDSDDIVYRRAAALVEAMQLSCADQCGCVSITGSVGVAICRPEGADAETLYKRADSALYSSKRLGKNRWTVWSGDEGERSLPQGEAPRLGAIQLHTLMEYMDGGVVVGEIGPEMRVLYLSPSYYKMMGLPGSTLGLQLLTDRIEPEDQAPLAAHLRSAALSGETIEHTYRTTTAAGEPRWHHVRCVRIPYEDSHLPVLIGVVSDVTAQKNMELALIENRREPVEAPGEGSGSRERKSVIVVDDDEINRRILEKILEKDYCVLQAGNGLDALEILGRYPLDIAAVLLDLGLPVMDGREFLGIMKERSELRNIPVLVTSASADPETEAEALSLGAWDFVAKPIRSETLCFRLKNAIIRSQLRAFDQLKYLSEFDPLTGVPNKRRLFRDMRRLLSAWPEEHFCFIRLDISGFSDINSFYGTEEGDRLLRDMGHGLRDVLSGREKCCYGRVQADVFGICLPYTGEQALRDALGSAREQLERLELELELLPNFGVYVIDEANISPEDIYRRANLAAMTCKSSPGQALAFYTPELSLAVRRERELTGDMEAALKAGQFRVLYQPIYDMSTGLIDGAEVLTDWNHPQKGVIQQEEYIPLFERCGFIAKLDRYVWEQALVFLRRRMDMGLEPLPLAVTLSRVSLYNPRLAELMIGLAERFGVPHRLLVLGISGSAWRDRPAVLTDTLGALQDAGFVIMMNDFGRSSTSLRALRDMALDILKFDLELFTGERRTGKGQSILKYTVDLAGAMGLKTMADGIRERGEAEKAAAAGCGYGKGDYYAPPMSGPDYEKRLGGRSGD